MSSGIAMAQRPSITRVPVFDSRRCKQCGLCAYVCPVGALEVPARCAPLPPHPAACSGCRACEFICPDFAVTMVESSPAPEKFRPAAAKSQRGGAKRSGDAGATV